MNKGRLGATAHGFIKGLLPRDFSGRRMYAEEYPRVALDASMHPFTDGYDLMGDQSLIAIELPGHADGQLGLCLTDRAGRRVFLVADSCWLSRSYRERLFPHPVARMAIANWARYRDTLTKLHQLHLANPELAILPSHCEEAAVNFRRGAHA
jgi:glyoxylase-like metal-dependent hydrolase (beta-lactamase superfamily II)